jgi:isopentenyl diphosphate isomerase/L-lactate dehydrogenase-like FMN-dependent dehydrogenase
MLNEQPTRRQILEWLAASPVLGLTAGLAPAIAGEQVAGGAAASASALRTAADALDVFDMEAAAQKIVPPAHWGYLMSGVDGETTLRANSAAYSKWQLVPRRFVDVSRMDLSTTLFGSKVASPVMISPIGGLRAIGPADGDIGVARAAKAKNQQHIVSTQMSDRLEDIAEARGAPLWYQLYTTNRLEATRQLVQRAQRAGCTVVAVTVDLPAGRNTVTASRLRREDVRPCGACHQVDANGNPRGGMGTKPMFAGMDTQGLGLTSPSLDWDFIRRLKDMTTMKVVLKGIEAEEDAALAVQNGADGILVSNHGGRALESGRGTIESLPDVVRGAAGRIPVMVDGGVRRGTDVFKALDTAVTRANKVVSKAESIRKFVVLTTDFTEDNGYLTPSLKVRRADVLRDFAGQIDQIYAK